MIAPPRLRRPRSLGAAPRRRPAATATALGLGALVALCAPSAIAAPMSPERVAEDVAMGGSQATAIRAAAGPHDGIEVAHVHLDATASSDARGETLTPGTRATVTTGLVRVIAPTLVEKDVALFGGFTYEAATVSLQGVDAPTVRPLVEMKATLGIDARFAEVWHLTALVAPGYFADAGRVDDAGAFRDEDIQVAAAAIVDRHFGASLTLGLGLAYASTFDLPVPLPSLVLGLEHQGWLSVDVVVPSHAEVDLLPHPRVAIGVRGEIETSTWNLDTAPERLARALGTSPGPSLDFDARVVTVGPTLAFRLVGPLVADVRFGAAFARKLELVDPADGEHSTRIDLAPCAAIRAGLGVRL